MSWPEMDSELFQSVVLALQARRWSISGPESKFQRILPSVEKKLAKFINRKQCIATVNGSSAILISLQALGIGPGKRVLLPATTWVGCATAIHRAGATPVFLDADAETPSVSASFSDFAQEGDPAAILAIHLYGTAVDIAGFRKRFPSARIIEDFAHCFGATLDSGRQIGTLGDLSITSFQATKILTCGEGGAVFSDDDLLARQLASLRADSRILQQADSTLPELMLQPGHLLHGANHCLSEVHASILWDQLARLPEQQKRRAEGLRIFASLLPSGIRAIFDQSCLSHGSFYGIPLWCGEGIFRAKGRRDYFIKQLLIQTGLQCGPLYPPIPNSPLYKPNTVALYSASNNPRHATYSNSLRWYESAIVIPHECFLSSADTLNHFSRAIAGILGKRKGRPPVKFTSKSESQKDQVTVILLTNGRPLTFLSALRSIDSQTYGGGITVIIVDDRTNYALNSVKAMEKADSRLTFRLLTFNEFLPDETSTIERVARLRNVALELVQTKYVCFLDDDNQWTPQHLASLVTLATTRNVPVVHSWRRIVTQGKRKWRGQSFPWLPTGESERRQFSICKRHRIIVPGSTIVRDAIIPESSRCEEFVGMVDLGEWLFQTELLRSVRFCTTYTQAETAMRVGEDDKLLRILTRNGIPSACTHRPSLIYALGGFSNT